MQSGGRSGKLGDRFELRWVVRRFLHLLADSIRSVSFELIGPDEAGVDLWLSMKDDTRIAEQCKRQRGTEDKWTVGSLHSEGVIGYIKTQLANQLDRRFRFISTTPAGAIRELSERARSTDDFDILVADISKNSGLAASFDKLCEYWTPSPKERSSRQFTCELLSRCEWETAPDGAIATQDLESMCRMHVDAEPDSTLSKMLEIAFDPSNWGKHIDQTRIWQLLADRGLRPRNLVNDPRVPLRIDKLQSDYIRAFEERTLGENLVPRSQVLDLLRELNDETSDSVCLVTGPAGYGKSEVLVELAKHLRNAATPFLAFRFDEQPLETGTATLFGQGFGLPDSPGLVLSAMHPSRRSVLILDQIDAIRWNTAHSAKSWNTCRQIIDEAQCLPNVRIVIACRSFDLENDPLFKNWDAKTKAKSFNVAELDEVALKKELGEAVWDELVPHQRQVLRRALNLHLWRTLRDSRGSLASFASGLDLMRAFWQDRLQRIEESTKNSDAPQRAQRHLVELLESESEISVPDSRFSSDEMNGLKLLQSLGVVRVRDRRVAFWHQSFGDYLIAEHILQTIGGQADLVAAVCSWIGGRDQQTLLRRGRIQLVFQLIADGYRSKFLHLVDQLKTSHQFRFHVRLLGLQVLAELSDPSIVEQDFVIKLLDDPYWTKHVRRDVLLGKHRWIGAASIASFIRNCVESAPSEWAGSAIWLLNSVKDQLGPSVAECLAICERIGGEAAKHTDYVLMFDSPNECEELFQLRLKCAREGRMHYPFDWAELAAQAPSRFIRLAAAWLKWFTERSLEYLRENKLLHGPDRELTFGAFSTDGLEKMTRAVEGEPLLAWRALYPGLVELFRRVRNLRRQLTKGRQVYFDHNMTKVRARIRVIERLLTTAGRVRAGIDLPQLLSEVNPNELGLQKMLTRPVFGSLMEVELSKADVVLEFLIAHRGYWNCGGRAGTARWRLVCKVLRRFGSSCSDSVFRSIEDAIKSWRRKVETDSIEAEIVRRRRLIESKHKEFGPNRFGEAARFLLAALPRSRMSAEAIGLLGCLRRKFGRRGGLISWRRVRGKSDWGRSPIDPKKAARFSDKTWMRLITGNRGTRSKKNLDRTPTIESPAARFSSDLRTAAEREPSRFARLGCLLPLEIAPVYFENLWWAFNSIRPKAELSDIEIAEWGPASVDELEALYRRLAPLALEKSDAMLCSIVAQRPEDSWSDQTIRLIVELCRRHPSPEHQKLWSTEKWSERTIGNLETTAVNSVRSLAALAISTLISERPDQFPDIDEIVSQLTADDHPSVRIATIRIVHALWRRDRAHSFESFQQLIDGSDDHLLGSRNAVLYLNMAQDELLDRLEPILVRMLKSDISEVRKLGAERIALLRWWKGAFVELYESIRYSADVEVRKGIYEIVSHELTDSKRLPGIVEEFAKFFDDEDPSIRDMAGRWFHYWDANNHDIFCRLCHLFIGTQAFAYDPTEFFYAAGRVAAPMIDIAEPAFRCCEEIRRLATTASADGQRLDHVDQVPQLLLRIYDESQAVKDNLLQQKCLDSWDLFLEAGYRSAWNQATELLREN